MKILQLSSLKCVKSSKGSGTDDLSFVFESEVKLFIWDADSPSSDDLLRETTIKATDDSGTRQFANDDAEDSYTLTFEIINV